MSGIDDLWAEAAARKGEAGSTPSLWAKVEKFLEEQGIELLSWQRTVAERLFDVPTDWTWGEGLRPVEVKPLTLGWASNDVQAGPLTHQYHLPADAPYRSGPAVREGDRIAYEDRDGNRIFGRARFDDDGSITIDGDAELEAAELWNKPQLSPTTEERPLAPEDPYLTVVRALYARMRESGSIWNLPDDDPLDPSQWTIAVGDDEPEARADGKPPVPKPSHTPPMWANNPGRTKRKRNRASDVRTPKS